MREQKNKVNIIIRCKGGIVIVKRKDPPIGWALPGGILNIDETLENAAIRTVRGKTGININILSQLKTYSDPKRNPKVHEITTVFIAEIKKDREPEIATGDNIAEVQIFNIDKIPKLVLDHNQILLDYYNRMNED